MPPKRLGRATWSASDKISLEKAATSPHWLIAVRKLKAVNLTFIRGQWTSGLNEAKIGPWRGKMDKSK